MTHRTKPNHTRHGKTHKITIQDTDTYVTLNRYENGKACEIFITTDRKSDIQGWATCFCIACSMALQNGVPASRIIEKLRGQRFDPQGGLHEPCSVADAIARWWQDEENAVGSKA
jgi:hypothetical protein